MHKGREPGHFLNHAKAGRALMDMAKVRVAPHVKYWAGTLAVALGAWLAGCGTTADESGDSGGPPGTGGQSGTGVTGGVGGTIGTGGASGGASGTGAGTSGA